MEGRAHVQEINEHGKTSGEREREREMKKKQELHSVDRSEKNEWIAAPFLSGRGQGDSVGFS